jgi:hypothetical protein
LQGNLVTVRILFERRLGHYIREQLWHPSQRIRDLPDGRVEVTLRVADTLEVRRWILGYGIQAEVIEPAAMREELRCEAMQLAKQLATGRKPLAVATRVSVRPATTGGTEFRAGKALRKRIGRG